jgi:recombination protein RecT
MSQNEIATSNEGRDRLRRLMNGMRTQIADVLPRHLDPDTLTRVVLVEGSRNPDLRLCTAESLAGTIMLASQLGLTPSSPLGQFYLVPRRETDRRTRRKIWRCGFVIGYRGFVELARRAGLRVNAGVVYQSEIDAGAFSWANEPPTLTHQGAIGVNRSDDELVLAYAVAESHTRQGQIHRWQIVLERETIDEARRLAQTDKVWSKHFAAMARKTAIRRLLNGGLVPLNAELETALQAENEVEARAAEVLDAGEIDALFDETPDDASESATRADPLRQALGVADDAIEPGAGDQGAESANPDRERVIERLLELEGMLSTADVQTAAQAAELGDGDIEKLGDEQLRRYLRELESRQ